jgi:hypothetical protein
MPINQVGSGVWLKRAIPLTLPAGAIYVPPAGQYLVNLGTYSMVQWYDPISLIWRPNHTPLQSDMQMVSFDGYNQRIVNLTGCIIGAYLTNGGSGYPNGIYPAGTPQTGSYVVATTTAGVGTATFNVIVGGCINTVVTITTAGVGYNNPPDLVFSDPPTGGVKASAIATVSGGAISGVTVINQGAGYTTAPTITVTPNPVDVTAPGQTNVGTPAVLTTTLTNSGRVTAVTIANVGNGYTAVPTITFTASAGTVAAATAIPCFTVTGVTAPGGGSANQTAAMLWLQSTPLSAAKTNAPVNPQSEQGLFTPRIGQCSATLTAGVASAIAVQDGGLHQVAAASILQLVSSAWATAAPTSSINGTLATGGSTDTALLIPF